MSVDCGRKPEQLERTHTDTGRTYKFHIERAQGLGIKPATIQHIDEEKVENMADCGGIPWMDSDIL